MAADDTLYDNHHLHPSIRNAIQKSDQDGGFDLRELKVGESLRMKTRNTEYLIVKNSDSNPRFLISGHHRLCPTPTPAGISGSTFGGSILKIDFIGVGMFLEFYLETENQDRMTSEILSVERVP